ncbi:MAG TPA: AAA family ATPase [Streptosporangiaceae bacterium]
MARFLITGDPGSGKSALAEALTRRGCTAYDSDDLPGVTRLEDAAGRPVDWPDPPVDWLRYGWNWQEAGLRDLLASAETVFVAAVVSNQEQYYSWFDAIFVLVADPATLRQRLLSRDGYGKHPAELAGILDGHAERTAELLSAAHAVAVDAARPLERVADDVFARAQAWRSG